MRPTRTVQRRPAPQASALSTGVRPFRIQRDEEEAGPSARAEDDAAGVLDSYLDKRQIARTVPPAGAWSADDGTVQAKPVREATALGGSVIQRVPEHNQKALRAYIVNLCKEAGLDCAEEVYNLANRIDTLQEAEQVAYDLVSAQSTEGESSALGSLSGLLVKEMQDLILTTGADLEDDMQQAYGLKFQAFSATDGADAKLLRQLSALRRRISNLWRTTFRVDAGQPAGPVINQQKITYAFHMTSYKNLTSIWDSGLDPSKGGDKGSGSCVIGGEETLQEASTRQSRGVVAAAIENQTLAPYIHMRGAFADLIPDQPIANYEALLRFPGKLGKDWKSDPKHTSALQTTERIGPEHIEILTEEGWKPLLKVPKQSFVELTSVLTPLPEVTRMAFDYKSIQGEFATDEGIRGALSSGDTYAGFKKLQGQKVTGRSGGEFIFLGATAHPITKPSEWRYVMEQTKAPKDLPRHYVEALKAYNKDILRHGTVAPRPESDEDESTSGDKGKAPAGKTPSGKTPSSGKEPKSAFRAHQDRWAAFEAAMLEVDVQADAEVHFELHAPEASNSSNLHAEVDRGSTSKTTDPAKKTDPVKTADPVKTIDSAKTTGSVKTTGSASPKSLFEPARFAVRRNVGGGDCLFHALEGRNLADDEMLAVRLQVSNVRSGMGDTLAGTALNAQQVATALFQTPLVGEALAARLVTGRHNVPNAVYARLQAIPGIYAGEDELIQWCRLHDRRVAVIDSNGSLAIFSRGGRHPIPVTPADMYGKARTAVETTDLALYKTPGHWERITGFDGGQPASGKKKSSKKP